MGCVNSEPEEITTRSVRWGPAVEPIVNDNHNSKCDWKTSIVRRAGILGQHGGAETGSEVKIPHGHTETIRTVLF